MSYTKMEGELLKPFSYLLAAPDHFQASINALDFECKHIQVTIQENANAQQRGTTVLI